MLFRTPKWWKKSEKQEPKRIMERHRNHSVICWHRVRVIAWLRFRFFFFLPFGCCCFINFSAWQIKIPFRGQNPEASHMGFRARNYFFFHAKWKSKLITSSTWAFAPFLCFWYDALNETKSSCTIVHLMKEEKRKFRCSRLSTHLFLSCSTHFELVK